MMNIFQLISNLCFNFSTVSLSRCVDGGVNASGARQNAGPVIPRNTGSGLSVSTVIFSRYIDALEGKGDMNTKNRWSGKEGSEQSK